MSRCRANMGFGESDSENFMRARVALNAQPAAASEAVIPKFEMRAGRVLAQVNRIEEARRRIHGIRIGPHGIRITVVDEFARVTLAAEGTLNAHRLLEAWRKHGSTQCRFGCGPTPFSSMSSPREKRSSR